MKHPNDHQHRHQHDDDDDDHRHHPNFWHKLPYLHSDTLAIQNWETILNSRQNDKRNLLKRNFPPPCQRTTYNAIRKKLSTQPSMQETILKMIRETLSSILSQHLMLETILARNYQPNTNCKKLSPIPAKMIRNVSFILQHLRMQEWFLGEGSHLDSRLEAL